MPQGPLARLQRRRDEETAERVGAWLGAAVATVVMGVIFLAALKVLLW